jgi:tellurite resistance protein TerC
LGGFIWAAYGTLAGSQYFSGYLIEKSLSVDNVFAWSVILAYFRVPKEFQYRVLYWGIFGALVMRAIFIFAGIALIERFEPILVLFGLILLYSGGKLLLTPESKEFDPATSKVLNWFKRLIPVSHRLHGHDFFTMENGKRVATMLFIALLAVELTDIVFAIDSVPAILAISRDPFIVFASNAAAILGLRSLFFVFETIKDKFWLLNHALGILLILVGIKMGLSPEKLWSWDWVGLHLPTAVNLVVIVGLIGGAMVLSVLLKNPDLEKRRA